MYSDSHPGTHFQPVLASRPQCCNRPQSYGEPNLQNILNTKVQSQAFRFYIHFYIDIHPLIFLMRNFTLGRQRTLIPLRLSCDTSAVIYAAGGLTSWQRMVKNLIGIGKPSFWIGRVIEIHSSHISTLAGMHSRRPSSRLTTRTSTNRYTFEVNDTPFHKH